MSAPKSLDEYAGRMQRVTEHIDRHLDQTLDLDTLAAVAHFSPFHFHRLFLAWMGETVGDYLRRRRCEIAATRLVAQPRVAVIQIALAVGFGGDPLNAGELRYTYEQNLQAVPAMAAIVGAPGIWCADPRIGADIRGLVHGGVAERSTTDSPLAAWRAIRPP